MAENKTINEPWNSPDIINQLVAIKGYLSTIKNILLFFLIIFLIGFAFTACNYIMSFG